MEQLKRIEIKENLYLELCLIVRDEIARLEEEGDKEGVKLYRQILNDLTKNNEAWLLKNTSGTFFFPIKK